MTHSIAKGPGRLCNQIIRNIALSIVAEKFDLKAEYLKNNQLNFPLYCIFLNFLPQVWKKK